MKIPSNKFMKVAAPAATALSLIVSLSACGGTSSDSGASNGIGTKTGGMLLVGSDLTYPPYDTRENGKPAGFDVEFVNALAKELKVKVSYQETRFAQIIAGVKASRYDLIASTLYISAERSAQVDFIPYFQTGNSIIVKIGDAALKTPQDLCGKSVSVVTATVIAKNMNGSERKACLAAGKPAIKVKEFPTDPEASQALLSGQVDAQMTDAAVAKSVVDHSKSRLELSSDSLIYPVAVGLAVKKGNTKLKAAVESGIEGMKTSGAYDKLLASFNLEPVDDKVLAESTKS
ncbi:ABC transporter substrate-binding protein [Aeromicrobium sp. P5_D10]